MNHSLYGLPSPAKLNLFLKITGRRHDGHHHLETLFDLIDLQDTIHLEQRVDGKIILKNPRKDTLNQEDLTVKAAKKIFEYSSKTRGVTITLHKRIPIGGGLGGGSSNAATVLIGLNRLWNIHLPRIELQRIGASIGADVPVFIFGRTAYATGVGEQCKEAFSSHAYYVLLVPPIHSSTAEVFAERIRSETIKLQNQKAQTNPNKSNSNFFPDRLYDSSCFRKTSQQVLFDSTYQCDETATSFFEEKIIHPKSFSTLVKDQADNINELQEHAISIAPEIAQAIRIMRRAADLCGLDRSFIRITGSGSCVFFPLDTEKSAKKIKAAVKYLCANSPRMPIHNSCYSSFPRSDLECGNPWCVFSVRSLRKHYLFNWSA